MSLGKPGKANRNEDPKPGELSVNESPLDLRAMGMEIIMRIGASISRKDILAAFAY